jgi:predicted GIY-YIG superfamily endonuclease
VKIQEVCCSSRLKHIFVATYIGDSYYTVKKQSEKIVKSQEGEEKSEAIDEYVFKKSRRKRKNSGIKIGNGL